MDALAIAIGIVFIVVGAAIVGGKSAINVVSSLFKSSPVVEAPKEPEAPAAAPAATDTDEKKKKGLFGKKKDR